MRDWRDSLAAASVVVAVIAVLAIIYALAASTDDPFSWPLTLGLAAQVWGVLGIWSTRRWVAAVGILLGAIPAATVLLLVVRQI